MKFLAYLNIFLILITLGIIFTKKDKAEGGKLGLGFIIVVMFIVSIWLSLKVIWQG